MTKKVCADFKPVSELISRRQCVAGRDRFFDRRIARYFSYAPEPPRAGLSGAMEQKTGLSGGRLRQFAGTPRGAQATFLLFAARIEVPDSRIR